MTMVSLKYSNTHPIVGFEFYNKSLIGFKTLYFGFSWKDYLIINLNKQSKKVLAFDFCISKAKNLASIKLINILLIGSHLLNSYLSIHFPVLWLLASSWSVNFFNFEYLFLELNISCFILSSNFSTIRKFSNYCSEQRLMIY